MSRYSEALERIESVFALNRDNKPNYYTQFNQSTTPYYEDYDLVYKQLQALEIMKKKRVDVYEFIKCSKSLDKLARYNRYASCDDYMLTQEEFELLKEVLCDE